MKYYEVNFTLSPVNSDACDLLAACAGEAGFETFEETSQGLKGYVQQQLFDRQQLDNLLQSFPFPGISIAYTVSEAEDRDWNEQWEQEGFAPIVVRDRLIVHDGRHYPQTPIPPTPNTPLGRRTLATNGTQEHLTPNRISIEIDARLAFGTGTHETTRMVCSTLLDLPLHGKRVLDCGTGTGILSICALKLGAAQAVGYDIDEWAADNARHNAVINQVDDRFLPLLGDVTILNNIEGVFDLVMANINRNILLADMPQIRRKMAHGGLLILSGFYTADIPLLTDKAASLGLQLTGQREEKEWACIVLQAQE